MSNQNAVRSPAVTRLLFITFAAITAPTFADQARLPQPDSVRSHDAAEPARHSKTDHDLVIFGTASFYNASGDMFTNRHVIERCDPTTIRVRIYKGALLPAKVIAKSSRYDLAALSTNYPTHVFGAIRVTDDGHTLIPNGTEDIFSAGFSSPLERNFRITPTWGQIEPWLKPNQPPYLQRMRMDAYPGASGSAVLDYGGLVIGILFAGSKTPVADPANLRSVGYGDRWIYLYDTNAIVSFANEHGLQLSAWSHWRRQDPGFIMGHAEAISGLVVCEGDEGTRPPADRAAPAP